MLLFGVWAFKVLSDLSLHRAGQVRGLDTEATEGLWGAVTATAQSYCFVRKCGDDDTPLGREPLLFVMHWGVWPHSVHRGSLETHGGSGLTLTGRGAFACCWHVTFKNIG